MNISWKGVRRRALNKPTVLVFAVLYSLLAVIGSTFSWITSSDSRVNEFRGETRFGTTITEAFTADMAWRPGTPLAKEIRVTNVEQTPAFVRGTFEEVLQLYTLETNTTGTGNMMGTVLKTVESDWISDPTMAIRDANELKYIYLTEGTISGWLLAPDEDETDYWLFTGGYLYYSEALQPGASTSPAVTGLELAGFAPNWLKRADYTLTVKLEAVQASMGAVTAAWGFSAGNPVYEMLKSKAVN
jgi:alternate signal-mediated exported protein